jgi:uncharacterized membrane protein
MDSFWTAVLLSMLPIAELRGGIPVALCGKVPLATAFIVCVLANSAIIIPSFLFLEYINRYFLKIPSYKRFFDRTVERARKKAKPSIDRYGYLGLAVFVGIPLPLTGAYTGTLAAWVLGMDKRKAFFAIAFGVLIAGIIVTLVASLGISSLRFFLKNAC